MKSQSVLGTICALCFFCVACAASAPLSVNPGDVRLVEAVLAPEQHLDLPRTLDGCEHKGMVRVSTPEGTLDPRFLEPPSGLVDQLKALAARKGANVLVVLPGKRITAGSFRGSSFFCSSTTQHGYPPQL